MRIERQHTILLSIIFRKARVWRLLLCGMCEGDEGKESEDGAVQHCGGCSAVAMVGRASVGDVGRGLWVGSAAARLRVSGRARRP